MIRFLYIVLLFFLPFIISPFGTTAFETPKVIVAESSIILLLLIALVQHKIKITIKHPLYVLYGLVFVLTIIDLLFFRTTVSFFGNAFRMQGIFLVWLLLVFSFLSSKISIKQVPWYVFLTLIFLQVFATMLLPLNESGRYVGLMGEPNASAALMLFLWPFLIFSLPKNKWLRIFCFVVSFFSVFFIFYLTESRSAVIGFVIQLIFLTVVFLKKHVGTAVIVTCFFIIASLFLTLLQRDVLYENRLEIWTAAFSAGMKNPLIGGGFGNTEILLHDAAVSQHLRVRGYYVDSSHNIFLDWWVQGGIIGLGVFVTAIFITLRSYSKKRDVKKLVILLGLLTAFSFNPASIVGLVQLWWLIGTSQNQITEKVVE